MGFAFRSTSLKYFRERIYRHLDIGENLGHIVLDIWKAFDKVWYTQLLHILKACVLIAGSIVATIDYFLPTEL